MKFTVELKEFWLNEEEELEPALKKHVVQTVVREILKSVETKINDAVTIEVKRQIDATISRKIQSMVANSIKNDKFKGEYSSDGLVTMEEIIKKRLSNTSGFQNPQEIIKKIADNFGSELKKRYDLLFASQIVASLSTNGLLKDDAVKLLLETIEKK
jgi:hypothetical protein